MLVNEFLEKPFGVAIEINNVCNAKCSFCGYGKNGADDRKKGYLDESVLDHVLKLMNSSGGGRLSLTPILGEITMSNNWLELISKIKKYDNISINCYTNGILLDQHGIEKIVSSKIDTMTLSTSLVDKESYRRLYGVDKYEKVKSNILKILQENKKQGFPIDIDINLRIDKPYKRFFDSSYYHELLKYILKKDIKTLDYYDDFKGIITQDDLPKNTSFKKVKADLEPCYALYRSLQIMKDGTIQCCTCRVEPELQGENIKSYKTIKEAWNSPTLTNIRTNWHNGIIPSCCQNCSHYASYKTNYRKKNLKLKIKTFLLNLIVKLELKKYLLEYRINKQLK